MIRVLNVCFQFLSVWELWNDSYAISPFPLLINLPSKHGIILLHHGTTLTIKAVTFFELLIGLGECIFILDIEKVS